MSKPDISHPTSLQYELWVSYGEYTDPHEMFIQLSKRLLKVLNIHSVTLLQQQNKHAAHPAAEYKFSLPSPEVTLFPNIECYRQLALPDENTFVESLSADAGRVWYCFALEKLGFCILEHTGEPLRDEVLHALSYAFGRFRNEYNGRLLQQHSEHHHQQIKVLSSHLRSEKDKLEQILGAISEGVMVLDWQGQVYFANHAAHNMLGLKAHEQFNGHFTNYFRIYEVSKATINLTRPVVEHCMQQGSWEREAPVILRCPRLPDIYARIVVRELSQSTSPLGKDSHFVCTFHDVTDIYQAEQKLKWQASHDTLTGCLNRRGFEATLQSIVNNQNRRNSHVLICMDLDRFKHVNDIGGHLAGDALLNHVTTLMQQEIRDDDTLARVGGDEFCIILKQCAEEEALEVAERIRKKIDQLRFKWQNNIFTIGISLGLSVIELEDDDADLVYSRTDDACNHSKENGRNQVSCVRRRPVDLAANAARSETGSQLNYMHYLNQALSGLDDSCKLVLFRQDINAITPGCANHQEVLLRIEKDGEFIGPNSFLPAAERCGKIAEIDIWVLSHTLDYLAEHKHCKLNVNLSGVTLSDAKARRQIYEVLLAYPVEARQLCLEITETAAITNLGHCIEFMEKLHQLGVTFALDDFGTGVSSFVYLKSLPVKYLKIDGSFIRDICNNKIDEILVQSIIAAAKAMKIRTVAEYVSDTNILEKVRIMGIDYAQGYCLGKPEFMAA